MQKLIFYKNILKTLLSISGVIILFYISSNQMSHVNYKTHNFFAINLFELNSVVIIYPIFPLIAYILNKISSNYLTTWPFLFCFIYSLRWYVLTKYLKNKNLILNTLFISFITIIIYPPFIHGHRSGFILSNMLESPTTIFAFPFSIMLYVYFVKNIQKINDIKYLIKILALSILVFLIKPSYILSFLPGVFLWALFYSQIQKKHKLILACIISFFLLFGLILLRLLHYGIGIDLFSVWLFFNNGSFLRLLLSWSSSLLLPIYVVSKSIETKQKLPIEYKFSMLIFLISLIQSIIFFDKAYKPAGNFLQALNMPFNIFLVENIIFIFNKENRKDYFGYFLVFLYVLSGILYYLIYLGLLTLSPIKL